MSKQFIPTQKRNPCPQCGDTTGKCRETTTLHLCMTFVDASTPIPGYRFIGLTKNGLWGKWIPEQDYQPHDPARRQWQQQPQRFQNQRVQAEHPRRGTCLAAAERHLHYERLLAQLTVHPADRADLHSRGLTDEQIQAAGFRSVTQWQPLTVPLPSALPGINLSSNQLNTPNVGYLCPIRNVEGQLVGFQLRLRHAATGGRYRWLTGSTRKRPDGPTPHLPNGELPLAVHRPQQVQSHSIALVEGVGTKPFILSQRLGLITIGAAGGQFASSPKTLKHTLETLSVELNCKTISFYPDAGAVRNRSVLRQYRATWKLLRQWGYEVQIAWWGQETKDCPDIDELEDLNSIQFITISQFEAIAHPRFDWLQRIKQQLQRKPKSINSAVTLRHVLGDRDLVQYQPGARLTTWKQAISQGYRYILDTSAPGTGKSFEAGQVDPQPMGDNLRQVMYLFEQHRNPTVETLNLSNGWSHLEARHPGLVLEKTPGGGDRLKRAEPGQVPSISANCARTRLIDTLRAKHVQGADTAAVICGSCPLREACTHAEGPGYGFLNQRRLALASPKLRSHPDSLPSPSSFDYAQTLLIWDEAGHSFRVKRDIPITVRDLEQILIALVTHPNLLQQVQPLIAKLLPQMNGQVKLPRFGLTHREVVNLLPDVSAIDIPALEKALQSDLSMIDSTAQYGVPLSDLPASLRKKFSETDTNLATQADQTLIKQWLPDLLRVLIGQTPGTLRLHHGLLTLSIPDTRHREIVQAAGATIFLDATLNREDLALKLGCDPNEIYLCRQSIPSTHNLRMLQVPDLGRMGMQRGNEQQRRATAIVHHYQEIDPTTQVIDFKKFANQHMGIWWRDSRGVNDFQQTQTLILVGTPCRNLADLFAEYAIVSGCQELDDPNFQAFVDRVIRADMHQAIGRLRAHRRPDETLQVIILSDFDLQLQGVERTKASAITLEAADKFEVFLLAVQRAVEQLQSEGKKITQSAIAAITDYSQQYISRYWKLLQTLLQAPKSNSSKSVATPPPEIVAIAEEVILGCQNTPELLAAIRDVFLDWLTPAQWQRLWPQLIRQAQINVLTALLLTLPPGQLVELWKGDC